LHPPGVDAWQPGGSRPGEIRRDIRRRRAGSRGIARDLPCTGSRSLQSTGLARHGVAAADRTGSRRREAPAWMDGPGIHRVAPAGQRRCPDPGRWIEHASGSNRQQLHDSNRERKHVQARVHGHGMPPGMAGTRSRDRGHRRAAAGWNRARCPGCIAGWRGSDRRGSPRSRAGAWLAWIRPGTRDARAASRGKAGSGACPGKMPPSTRCKKPGVAGMAAFEEPRAARRRARSPAMAARFPGNAMPGAARQGRRIVAARGSTRCRASREFPPAREVPDPFFLQIDGR